MTLNTVLQAIHDTGIASAVRGDSGWEWLFPNIETLHVLAIAIVFGSILMVDLRLLGVTARDSAVSKLSREVLPITWTAFSIAVISGALLFSSKAQVYFGNLQFELKFLFMLLAGINMAIFHLSAYRRVAGWDYKLPPPIAVRMAGALSILLWMAVIFMGRWVGFTT